MDYTNYLIKQINESHEFSFHQVHSLCILAHIDNEFLYGVSIYPDCLGDYLLKSCDILGLDLSEELDCILNRGYYDENM